MKKTHHKGKRKGEMKIKNIPGSYFESPCSFMHFSPLHLAASWHVAFLLLLLVTWQRGLLYILIVLLEKKSFAVLSRLNFSCLLSLKSENIKFEYMANNSLLLIHQSMVVGVWSRCHEKPLRGCLKSLMSCSRTHSTKGTLPIRSFAELC